MSSFVDFLAEHLTQLLTFVVASLGILYFWLQHHFSYWRRQNIPYIKPNPIFGNFKELFMCQKDPCTHFGELYNHEVAKDQPVVGMHVINRPCLLIRDLELVKAILIKDFNKFSNRYSSSDPHNDSLGSDNLFFAKNPKWKKIRVKLSPVFSSGKIKQMFPLIEEIGRELDKYLLSLTEDSADKSKVTEVKNVNALFTTDVITTIAYGVQVNSLKNPENEFRRNGKRIFHFTRRRALEFTSMFFFPGLVRLLRFKAFSPETTIFIRKTVQHVMSERMRTGHIRNDLIDVLVNFKKHAEAGGDQESYVLEKDFLVAQAAVFFSAGFETSSSTMSFSLYELAKRPEMQKRLRDEIKEALIACNGTLTYETIMDLKFLDCVIKEVLRFYPPLPFLDRECTLEANETGYSLKPYVDYEIPNGMPVYIPMCSFHMDPKYFPEPTVFDPDRFAPENKHKSNMNAYMPFGIGPHNCIGERFGVLQAKIGLINFLRNHYVAPCEKSHKEMILDPNAIIIQSQGGIFCKIVRDPLIA